MGKGKRNVGTYGCEGCGQVEQRHEGDDFDSSSLLNGTEGELSHASTFVGSVVGGAEGDGVADLYALVSTFPNILFNGNLVWRKMVKDLRRQWYDPKIGRAHV